MSKQRKAVPQKELRPRLPSCSLLAGGWEIPQKLCCKTIEGQVAHDKIALIAKASVGAAFGPKTGKAFFARAAYNRIFSESADLMISADRGGRNGSRCRLWKVALQDLADETGLKLTVCHFPPGTSKWNKIKHRLFCHITQNLPYYSELER